MSSASIVVVLEGRHHKNLVNVLSRWGYSTIVVEDMYRALRKIAHSNVVATVVDGNGTIDVLEFVLNVSEVDDTLPVIVVRPSIESHVRELLDKQSNVHFLSTRDDDYRSKLSSTLGSLHT